MAASTAFTDFQIAAAILDTSGNSLMLKISKNHWSESDVNRRNLSMLADDADARLAAFSLDALGLEGKANAWSLLHRAECLLRRDPVLDILQPVYHGSDWC